MVSHYRRLRASYHEIYVTIFIMRIAMTEISEMRLMLTDLRTRILCAEAVTHIVRKNARARTSES